MPNHITNILNVSGPAPDLTKFRQAVEKKVREAGKLISTFDFNGTVPMPESIKGTVSPCPKDNSSERLKQVENIKKYGTGNWYDWSCKNWGTKWGAYDAETPEVLTGSIRYRFNTAWSAPYKWLEKTCSLYPSLEFKDNWIDEGGGAGCLTCSKGNMESQRLTDHDWKLEWDEDYKEEYLLITEGDYKEVLDTYLDNSEDIPYDLEIYLVDRILDRDLPLFISVEWNNDKAKDKFLKRIKE